MHSVITPAIMYWGTPVVLITTENDDGTANIAPISSAWWLGHRCVLGLAAASQTTINLLRTKQCVLNLPSDDMGSYINAIAKTTGSPVIPPVKQALGYEHCKDKFTRSGLTPHPSDLVQPPRIAECPVQMEAELAGTTELMQDMPDRKGFILAIEVKVIRTHVQDELRLPGHSNRIDPDRWRPMIMSFQELYGLAPKKTVSTLASIDEEKYRPLTVSNVGEPAAEKDKVGSEEAYEDAAV
ncbi:hypothetical protein PG997_008893 [Apiospora hydei]|uniref:Flavin reductase like domain-containing protein n=1 Tax=Apiospora hydei TaxID=1337664 RepID=A0ABR1WC49_9PEZI